MNHTASQELPFEIHVTVQQAEKEHFISACHNLKVKPILLSIQTKQDSILDVMTSSTFVGNDQDAFNEMKRISNGLNALGLNVIREKIETVPWHHKAPNKSTGVTEMPNNCYFESHVAVTISDDSNLRSLKDICHKNDLHLSRNVFKENDDGSYIIMATYRKYDGSKDDFENQINIITSEMTSHGLSLDKTIIEFAVYDSNVSHDNLWLN